LYNEYYFNFNFSSRDFLGREKQLSDVMAYITANELVGQPLTVVGSKPGCGLTAFIAKAANETAAR